MKKMNKLRAELICSEYTDGICSIAVTDILQRFLKNCPSIIERGQCRQKGCTSRNHDFNLPVLGMNEVEFNGNFINLVKAVISNFPNENKCRKCRKPYHSFERICGHHLFIEVILRNFLEYFNDNFFFSSGSRCSKSNKS